MRVGFFVKEALRALSRNAAPSLAAMVCVLLTALVLGVFIPIVQATTGTAKLSTCETSTSAFEAGSNRSSYMSRTAGATMRAIKVFGPLR